MNVSQSVLIKEEARLTRTTVIREGNCNQEEAGEEVLEKGTMTAHRLI